MKTLFRCLIPLACLFALALPAGAAERGDDYAKDAAYAEGTPATVPHRMDDKAHADCLACHLKGVRGAPVTPHPERRDCAQCHVQGEIKRNAAEKKKEGKKR
jgi:nitrate reductase cytochrome c-type subunit